MKLSQLTTNEGADVLLLLAPEIEILTNDMKLIELIQGRKTTKDKNEAISLTMSYITKLSVYLLEKHREPIWNILAALNKKTAEQIGKQLFAVTLKQLFDTINDKDFMTFFQPSAISDPEMPSDI